MLLKVITNNFMFGQLKNTNIKFNGDLAFEIVDNKTISRSKKEITFKIYNLECFKKFAKTRGLKIF